MEELLVIVKPQEELPKVNRCFEVEKLISGKRCAFKVKKIVEIRWNILNELIVTVAGHYLYMD